MTGLLDGMAGVLSDMFGAPVSHTPAGGSAVQITGVFRQEQVRIADETLGEYLDMRPLLRVLPDVAAGISRGDTIAPGDGQTYKVLARQPSGSPALDAFVIFELERII